MSPAELLMLAQARKVMAEAMALEHAIHLPLVDDQIRKFDVDGAFEQMAAKCGELVGKLDGMPTTSVGPSLGPSLQPEPAEHPHGGQYSVLGIIVAGTDPVSANRRELPPVTDDMVRLIIDVPFDRARMPIGAGSAVWVTSHR